MTIKIDYISTIENKEMREISRIKSNILIRQTRQIKLPEDKVAASRNKYFQLKYADLAID